MAWSYDLLEDDERRVFRALSAFAGSFDVEAVAAVAEVAPAAASEVVESLYGRSMVASSEDGPGRFRLLETLKAYAEERLAEAGEAAAVRERHVQHFADRSRVGSLFGADDRLRADRLVVDEANLTLAADRLEADERWDELATLLFGLPTLTQGGAPALLPRVRRALDHVTDPDRVDRLRLAEVFLTMTVADWSGYLEACMALLDSPDPHARAHGNLRLALITAATPPTRPAS